MRLITIKMTPHVKRSKYKGGSTGHGSDGVLRIATNLLNVPAEIIAIIFKYRWTNCYTLPFNGVINRLVVSRFGETTCEFIHIVSRSQILKTIRPNSATGCKRQMKSVARGGRGAGKERQRAQR